MCVVNANHKRKRSNNSSSHYTAISNKESNISSDPKVRDVESVSLAATEKEKGAENAVSGKCGSGTESRKSLFVDVAYLRR